MLILCIVFYCITSSTMSVCESSMQMLIGNTGDNVTLPCSYNVKAHDRTDMCWGKAKVPASKCSNTIISTDGDKVNFRKLERYQLLRGVMEGDVSLTIINVTENDSGIYGCRVEIPGLFNDLKRNFNLIIVKGTPVSNSPVTTANMPLPNTGQGEWTTPAADTGSLDGLLVVLVQAQDISQTFKENAVRMGAVLFVLGLILIAFLGLRRSQKNKCRSAHLDHSALDVQVTN
ncbi:hypothetical protein AAFF_G00310290 [Aldrovandia affinis]|uniref:Ig-like domain-containing protein n=1 Tax=Aldrovandia affinis TaxID=143900 RepID=A0AAD7SP62_9TELE|nr:hypothetical protein AAFF_G00310290 [Aldrovandia affinis]